MALAVLASELASMPTCFVSHSRLRRVGFAAIPAFLVWSQLADAQASPTMVRTPSTVALPGAAAPAPRASSPAPAPAAAPPAAAPAMKRTPSSTAHAVGTAAASAPGPSGTDSVGSGASAASARTPPAVEAGSAEPKIIGLATDGVAVVRATTLTEKRAAAMASEAMNRDFLNTDFALAEKKLRRAVETCLTLSSCSVAFIARLHRDIGVVYIVGMDKLEEGKDEFAAALSADMTVAIVAETNTEAVEAAFMDVKRSILAEGEGKSAKPSVRGATMSRNAKEKREFSATPAPGADAWREVPNWFSIGVQQDFMIHTSTENVCNAGSRYRCYDAQTTSQDFSTLPAGAVVTKGNEISSTGLKTGTTRLLIGYERLLSKNFSIGLKVGLVVAGKAPRYPLDPAVTLFHGEGRLTVYPGAAPFAPKKVTRPYLFASGGIAEVDSKIAVEVHVNNQPAQVLAWKRSGKGFVGAGFGLAFAFGKNHGPFLEARVMRMLEKPAYTGAAQAGYAVGF